MSSGSFASLTSGLLARKGEARPSAEQNLATVLRTPTYRQPEQQAPIGSADADPEAGAEVETAGEETSESPALSPLANKVRIEDAYAMWPAKKPSRPAAGNEDDIWRLDQRLGLPPSPRHTERTSVRLTHAQARALRLAALVLDRPQQDLIEAGIEGKLEALACTDLASCSCFKALLVTLEKH
jgi:hypothetical protein